MQRKRIERRKVIGYNGVSGNLPRFWDQVHRRSGQCRHVQRLANVANRVRPAAMLVSERPTRGEIQKRNAPQNSECASAVFEGRKSHVVCATHVSVAT